MAAAPTTRPWRAPRCSAACTHRQLPRHQDHPGARRHLPGGQGRRPRPSVHGDESASSAAASASSDRGFADADLDIEKPDHRRGGPRRQGRGWRIENHYGAHAEKVVYINFVVTPSSPTTTTSASSSMPGRRQVQARHPQVLVTAAVTVEKLAKGTLKKAILVPNPLSPRGRRRCAQGPRWDATIGGKNPRPLSTWTQGHPRVDGRPDNKAMAAPRCSACTASPTARHQDHPGAHICKEVKAAGHVPSVHGDESGILGAASASSG